MNAHIVKKDKSDSIKLTYKMNKTLNEGKSLVKIMRKTTGFAKKFNKNT